MLIYSDYLTKYPFFYDKYEISWGYEIALHTWECHVIAQPLGWWLAYPKETSDLSTLH